MDRRRKPEDERVTLDIRETQSEGEKNYIALAEGLPRAEVIVRPLAPIFALELVRNPLALIGVEPGRIPWIISKIEPSDDSKNDRRRALQDEHPAPSGHARPVQLQENRGDRSAQQE